MLSIHKTLWFDWVCWFHKTLNNLKVRRIKDRSTAQITYVVSRILSHLIKRHVGMGWKLTANSMFITDLLCYNGGYKTKIVPWIRTTNFFKK